jgi:hypothetical protein
MHQRTERGFASVAQLLSFLAAGSAAIMPTLRDDLGDHFLCNTPSSLAQQHIVPVRWLKLVRGAV